MTRHMRDLQLLDILAEQPRSWHPDSIEAIALRLREILKAEPGRPPAPPIELRALDVSILKRESLVEIGDELRRLQSEVWLLLGRSLQETYPWLKDAEPEQPSGDAKPGPLLFAHESARELVWIDSAMAEKLRSHILSGLDIRIDIQEGQMPTLRFEEIQFHPPRPIPDPESPRHPPIERPLRCLKCMSYAIERSNYCQDHQPQVRRLS